MNWQELASTSQYQTALAIEKQLQHGNSQEAMKGIGELIESLSRSDKRALRSQLVRLLMHIIKWKTQPEKRSLSWMATIQNSREEIFDLQQETPSLSDEVIKQIWDQCLAAAKREAEGEMGQKIPRQEVSWEEVFKEAYEIS